MLDSVVKSDKRGWSKWLGDFFRPRKFDVEWDGKVRGYGPANVGVPQGSPLSPVVFLIWMAPILGGMERIREKVGIGVGMAGRDAVADVELPSFVDDMCEDIVVWEEGCSMQRVEANVSCA